MKERSERFDHIPPQHHRHEGDAASARFVRGMHDEARHHFNGGDHHMRGHHQAERTADTNSGHGRGHSWHHHGQIPGHHGQGAEGHGGRRGHGGHGGREGHENHSGYKDTNRHLSEAEQRASAHTVANIARQMGKDPVTSVAMMLAESGGDPRAVGDHGTSFGLMMLHKGGELGSMSPEQAFNPETNIRTSLSHLHGSGGEAAAAAQGPKHPGAYAHNINNRYMAQARRLLGEA